MGCPLPLLLAQPSSLSLQYFKRAGRRRVRNQVFEAVQQIEASEDGDKIFQRNSAGRFESLEGGEADSAYAGQFSLRYPRTAR